MGTACLEREMSACHDWGTLRSLRLGRTLADSDIIWTVLTFQPEVLPAVYGAGYNIFDSIIGIS